MSHTLNVQNVSWSTEGVKILDRVTAEVRSGDLVAVMGKNGAGKSTLLDLIAGLRPATAGHITFDGRATDRISAAERARHIAHLPQLARGDWPFSVEQLVMMGRYPHTDRWFESDDDRRVIETAMRRCQCLELRERRLATLSGGERQRALLAACLAQQADALLLDEPSTFLDVDQQLHCFSLLREEAQAGRLCLAVTHDLNLALTFCTRILILANHTIVRDVTVAEAVADSRWLSWFSPRLTLDRAADGTAWVSYR